MSKHYLIFKIRKATLLFVKKKLEKLDGEATWEPGTAEAWYCLFGMKDAKEEAVRYARLCKRIGG